MAADFLLRSKSNGSFRPCGKAALVEVDRRLRAEAVSKLGGGICLRVAFRIARRDVVSSSFFAVVGLMGLSRRIAAPEVGCLSPDQTEIACIRRRMPIRETARLML